MDIITYALSKKNTGGSSGATEEQATQIQTNTNNISELKEDISSLSKEIVDLQNDKANKTEVATMVETEVENEKGNIVNQIIQELQGLPVFGVVDENNEVTITSQLSDGAYTLRYENKDGTKEDLTTFKIGDGTSYTNLADPTSSEWLTNTRLGSSGTSTLNGVITTNIIQGTINDTYYIKGLDVYSMLSNSSYPRMHTLKDNGTSVIPGETHPYYIISNGHGSIEGDVYILNGIYTGTNALNQSDIASTDHVRFCGVLLDGYTAEDVVITKNEKIE